MSAKEKFEQWAIDNGKVSLVAYGSQVADFDYMLFSDENFKAEEAFPGSFFSFSRGRACLVVSDDEYFDVALARPKMGDVQFVERRDMLRNSTKPFVWICDVHGLKDKFDVAIATSDRAKMTDEQITAMLRGYFVNLKFIQRKIFDGNLYGRFLLVHSVEPTIFQLARQYDLRRGGKGKWRGRDAERIFTPEQLKMMSLRAPLDPLELAKELFATSMMIKFWLHELAIPVPSFLDKITW
jgi:hypothetical protein